VSTNPLHDISKSINDELKTFELLFKTTIKSKVSLVDLIASYILKQKGKKIRPLLAILSANACGGVTPRTYRGAALVELLHTATLVHDDVVDNSDKRRGLPSINAVWKNKIAVLMGDYLLSRGLLISVENKDYDFLEVMTNTVKRMSEGELLQIQKTRKLDIDAETYFRIISDKTASLFQTCCAIGAQSASNDATFHAALDKFGENLGIAFQIRDDILDFGSPSKFFGKPIGGDIKEKKITLPLIFAMNEVHKSERDHIKNLIKNGSKKKNITTVIRFVHEKGGIVYSEKVAKEYGEKAKECLNVLPDSEAKQSLIKLVDFVISRSN
jgi:octaprenyl-diphosphate synthase